MIENLRPKEDMKIEDEGKKSVTSNKWLFIAKKNYQ